MLGKVKWFNNDRGYGFIECNNKDIMVHYSSILEKGFKSLVKDELVSFEVVKTDKGLRAKKVRTKKELTF